MMTSEKAIQLLHRLQDEQFDGIHGDERRGALEMAVSALVDPNIGQKTIDCIIERLDGEDTAQLTQTNADSTQINTLDCVGRQAAIDAVAKWFYDVFGIKESDGTATIFKRLRELPSAQPESRTGHWILSEDRYWKTCSECGADVDVSLGLGLFVDNDEVSEKCFCPNCGADMRGESE